MDSRKLTKLKGKSLVETLVALIIISASIGLWFMAFFQLSSKPDLKKRIQWRSNMQHEMFYDNNEDITLNLSGPVSVEVKKMDNQYEISEYTVFDKNQKALWRLQKIKYKFDDSGAD